jgi:hypothetical protein
MKMKRSRYFLAMLITLNVISANDASAQGRIGQRRSLNVERGWLGFSWNPAAVRVNNENRPGAVIEEVVANSPAARAGLEQGDTVIAINGLRVTERFMATLAETLEPGDEVRVRVRSGSRDREITLTADTRPENYPFEPRAYSFNYEITPDSLRRRMQIYLDTLRGSLGTLELPRMRVERRPGGEVYLYQGDSLMVRLNQDSTWRGMRGGGGVWVLPRDSMRIFGDSMLFRALPRMRGQLFELDSTIRMRMDTLRLRGFERGRIYGFSGDSVWQFETGPNSRFGITMFGTRAIGGAELTELNPGLGEYFGTDSGVLVVRVPDGSPADRAGLEAGDVILSINGRDIESMADLRNAITRAPRDPIRMEILRRKARQTIELRQS